MAVKLINKKQTSKTKVKIVSKSGNNISIENTTENPSMILSNSSKTLTLDLLPINDAYKGIQSDNVLFNENSFETKALGDSLYTNSNVITGGLTPFTVEFYCLLKDLPVNVWNFLYSKNNNNDNSDYGLFIKNNILSFVENASAKYANKKIYANEINKYCVTYDGAALRLFINDLLELIIGTSNGFVTYAQPLRFLDYKNPSLSQYNSSTKGIIDNINIHDGIATKVRDYDPYEEFLVVDLAFDGVNNSTKIVDNGSLGLQWSCYNGAKLSTTQPFDGFSSLYLTGNNKIVSSQEINLDYNNFTVNFKLKHTSNSGIYYVFLSTSVDPITPHTWYITHAIDHPNSIITNRIMFGQEGYSNRMFVSSKTYDRTKDLDIVFIRQGNTLTLYVNNVFDKSFDISSWPSINLGRINLGVPQWSADSGFIGFVSHLKIYKGVAVIPENTTGKIKLDFDNNLVDKYGNSTWTNNGVTFDNINSVKGHAAYFDSITTDYLETSSESLNFNKGNFKIDFSFKNLNSSGELFSNNISPNSVGAIWYPINPPNSPFGYLDFYGRPSNTTYNDRVIIGNVWYDNSIVKKNNILIEYRNDVIAYVMNGVSNTTFNLIGGGMCRIGKPTSTFGAGFNGFGGYLDNFKSYKEDLVNLNSSIYLTGSNGGDVAFNTNGDALNSVWASGTATFPIKRYVYVFNDCPSVINYKIEAEVIISSTNNKIFRLHTNTNNYQLVTEDYLGYSLYLYDNVIKLSKGGNNSSNWVDIAQATLPTELRNDKYHLFKIIKNDNNFQLYVDDILYININDSQWANISSKLAFGGHNYNATSLRTTSIKSIRLFDLNDNELYYRDWKPKLNVIIDKPAVHLPLETNATNIGFTPLTINSIGSPTYHVVDGKKCIKFESGKYLTINSNNIFNLGTSSDFYIEFDFYHNNEITSNNGGYPVYVANMRPYASGAIWVGTNSSKTLELILFDNMSTRYVTTNSLILNTWNNFKLYRKGDILYLVLNGEINSFSFTSNINLSNSGTYVGTANLTGVNQNSLNGYMSNFKMFVGTSEIPETYNDKKVLDLDFKPTRKSYLFKDNNNKCVIHPVNITQRDYQNSQYCCTFNGTNQYLQLGKNDLLNFGNDDFIIEMKFNWSGSSIPYGSIIANGNVSASNMDFIMVHNNNTMSMRATNIVKFDNLPVAMGDNEIIVARSNNVLSVLLNGNLTTYNITEEFNLNRSNNTYIGKNSWDDANGYFCGTIYSIKILRNTSDLSVLGEEYKDLNNYTSYFPFETNYKEVVSDITPTTVKSTARLDYDSVIQLKSCNETSKRSLSCIGEVAPVVYNSSIPNLNFGFDDYSLGCEVYCSNPSNNNNIGGSFIGSYINSSNCNWMSYNNHTIQFGINSHSALFNISNTLISNSQWYDVKICRLNGVTFGLINDSVTLLSSVFQTGQTEVNLNKNNTTQIGGGVPTLGSNPYFSGNINNIYGIKAKANLDYIPPYTALQFKYNLTTDLGTGNINSNWINNSGSLDEKGGETCIRLSNASENNFYRAIGQLGSTFTINFDLYLDSSLSLPTGTNKVSILHYNNPGDLDLVLQSLSSDGNDTRFTMNVNSVAGTSTTNNVSNYLDKWVTVKIVKDSSIINLYINNTLISSCSVANEAIFVTNNSLNLFLGASTTSASEQRPIHLKNFLLYKGLKDIPGPVVDTFKTCKQVLNIDFTRHYNKSYLIQDKARRFIVGHTANLDKYSLVNIKGKNCIYLKGDSSQDWLQLGSNSVLTFNPGTPFLISINFFSTASSGYMTLIGSNTSSGSNQAGVYYNADSKTIEVKCNSTVVLAESVGDGWNNIIIKRDSLNKFSAIINSNLIEIENSSSNVAFDLNYNGNTYIGKQTYTSVPNYKLFEGYISGITILKDTNDLELLYRLTNASYSETIAIKNPPLLKYYPMTTNYIDSFGLDWFQSYPSSPVTYREIATGQTGLSFNGINGVYCNTLSNKLGLNKFTIEFDLYLDSFQSDASNFSVILSYGFTSNRTNYFILGVDSAGKIVLRPSWNSTSGQVITTTSVSVRQKYRIAVTRDSDMKYRVYIDSNKILETTFTENLASTLHTDSEEGYITLGKNGIYTTSNNDIYGMKGILSNFNLISGICKYTEDTYTVIPFSSSLKDTYKLTTKCLLNVDSAMGTTPSTIVDSYNNSLTWTNTGATVEAFRDTVPLTTPIFRSRSLRFSTIANRVLSPVNEALFNLKNNNFSIDLIFTPTQISAEAVLLDTRTDSATFKGIVVTQPQSSPSSLEIRIGSSTNTNPTNFDTVYNMNSILTVGNPMHLRITRNNNQIRVFTNGTLRTTIDFGFKEIGYSDRIILGNNDTNAKGFNGYITQFKFQNKMATNYQAFNPITEELK